MIPSSLRPCAAGWCSPRSSTRCGNNVRVRLFVALMPPAKVLADLSRVVGELRAERADGRVLQRRVCCRP